MPVIVTTNVSLHDGVETYAKELARRLEGIYTPRLKKTVKQLLTLGDVLVVYQDKLVYYNQNQQLLFFHPDTAMIRIKQNKEPLLSLIGDRPKKILDATLGLGSDSIVLSYAGHDVTSLEGNKIIFTIVSAGLQQYHTGNKKIDDAMRRIHVIYTQYLDYLKSQPNNAYDVIYFDPMFDNEIEESKNLDSIREIAIYQRLSDEVMQEAKRVAKEKIIVKAHYLDPVFDYFSFERHIRKHAKFHFGWIEIQ